MSFRAGSRTVSSRGTRRSVELEKFLDLLDKLIAADVLTLNGGKGTAWVRDLRNKFIINLAKGLEGNTLILYSRVATHGEPLFEKINSSVSEGRKVFFVHGGVDSEEREEVRRITENESNAIIVASYGTFSTGINIRNLHNVIFASPSKSRIRNLQSIGRVLRKGKNKNKATLYDIADDCTVRSLKNYTLNHLIERIKIYNQEKFNYDIINIDLKN